MKNLNLNEKVRINLNEDSYTFDMLYFNIDSKTNIENIIKNNLINQYNYRASNMLWCSIYQLGNEIARYILNENTKDIELHNFFKN
jgi:hypothetical protein